jgi:hypothetical protein
LCMCSISLFQKHIWCFPCFSTKVISLFFLQTLLPQHLYNSVKWIKSEEFI